MVDLKQFVRDVPDYPKPGILFRDITPLLADAVALEAATCALAELFAGEEIDVIAAAEDPGFHFCRSIGTEIGGRVCADSEARETAV